MPVVEIPFGEWLPSAPTFKNPGCEVADNVIPTAGSSYGPFQAITINADFDLTDEEGTLLEEEGSAEELNVEKASDEAASAVKGARQLFDSSANNVIVGGTDTTLFVRRSTLEETSGFSSIGSGEAWDFAQFNQFVVATANNNAPQYLTALNSDNEWSALTGSPPNAKRCARVGDFLMLGNVASAETRIQWSAYNDPTGSWAASRLTQAGSADLPLEGGPVQRIIGGRYALVFQERAISRLSYVGPPLVFRRDEVTSERGAIAPFAVVQVGFLVYYLAQDGFYVTNGSQNEPIGNNRINRWFFDTVDQRKIGEVHGAVDWQNESIVWMFSEGGTGYDRALIYTWGQNRFASATFNVDWIVGSQEDGIDLDSLDATYSDLDSIPVSLDSAQFRSGERILGGFQDNVYGTFSGGALEAVFETGSTQVSPGQRAFISEVMPIIDAQTRDERILVKSWDNRHGASQSSEKVTGWSGFAPVRAECQKAAVRVTKPANTVWEGAQAVQVRFRPAGYR